jgi:hypothetical protein
MVQAQDSSSMTGIVTDSSGAVVPGTTVVLKNPSTGVSYTQTTNEKGAYRFTTIPPDPGYVVTFSHSGFTTVVVKDVTLVLSQARTQDAKLQAGATEVVEVSAKAAEQTINTTDATVGNNIDPELLNDLPVQNRTSVGSIFTLQPGVNGAGSTTGSRTDQDQVTVDGLDVNDISTGQAFLIVAGAPIDSVQEIRSTVAGFNTDSGPGGGGQFATVTKNGTNKFHGDINEYHRDTALAANTWFNKLDGLGRTPLIQNQFGGNIGGPIKRDKLFFFFDFNDSRIIQSSLETRTVPLDSFRAGNIDYILAHDTVTGSPCTATSRQSTTPNCIGTYTPAQVMALDPAHIGESSVVFGLLNSDIYPHANNVNTGGDGVNTGSYAFTTPTPTYQANYVGRVDFNLTKNQKLYGVGRVAHEDAVEQAPEFAGDPSAPFQDRSYSWTVGHIWQIGGNKVNQIVFGDTVEDFNFPIPTNPEGTNLFSLGGLSAPYLSPVNAQGRRLPIMQVNDSFQWQKGAHTLSFGGFFKYISTSDHTILDYNQASIGLGGEVLSLNSNLRPADIRTAGTAGLTDWDTIFPMALGRIGAVSQQFNYGADGTAFPLGHGDDRNYRYFQTELYVGDTWRATPSLTLSYGVNYQIFSVPYEIHGLESVSQLTDGTNVTPFTFDSYIRERVTQSANHVTGPNAVPFIQYVLGGKANNGPNLYDPEYHDFAPRFAFSYNPAFDRKAVFNGSIGIVYDRTVTNAVQYQQDQHSYLFQQSNNVSNGDSSSPTLGFATDPRVGANFSYTAPGAPPAAKTPFIPYVDANGNPTGLANGEDFNTTIDSHFRTPYNIMVSAGMQREFPAGFILRMNYAGRFGRRLLGQADANEIVDYTDPASGQTASAAMANVTKQTRAGVLPQNLTPQPWFENVVAPGIGVALGAPNNTALLAEAFGTLFPNGDFGDVVQALASNGLVDDNVTTPPQFSENSVYTNKGFSTYHGLLINLHKNLNHGLQFDVNYTWSHSIDNVSLIANAGASGGYGFVCNVFIMRQCRGNSDFDITQVTTSDYTYQLPVGRGRSFGANMPLWLDEVIGGWETSGIVSYHTGYAWGTVSNAFVPSYSNDAAAFYTGSRGDVKTRVHKKDGVTPYIFNNDDVADVTDAPGAAFNGPVGFDVGPRNNFRGPGYFDWDAALAKSFAIVPAHNIVLKFRGDFFNVLNHPSFNAPAQPNGNSDITNATFGQITSTNGSARVGQVGARLEF